MQLLESLPSQVEPRDDVPLSLGTCLSGQRSADFEPSKAQGTSSSAVAVETEIPRTWKATAARTSAATKLPRTQKATTAAQATTKPEPSKTQKAVASKASDAALRKGHKITVFNKRTRVVLSSDSSDDDSDALGDEATTSKSGIPNAKMPAGGSNSTTASQKKRPTIRRSKR